VFSWDSGGHCTGSPSSQPVVDPSNFKNLPVAANEAMAAAYLQLSDIKGLGDVCEFGPVY
jgi:hypothetical protein